jgi:hypothetical protein
MMREALDLCLELANAVITQVLQLDNCKNRNHLGHTGIHRRIIIKQLLRKWGVRAQDRIL